MFTNEIYGANGYIFNKAQINVSSTMKTSKNARLLFLSLNCKGIKARLNTIFKKNGNITVQVIYDFANILTAAPNVKKMPI